MFVKELLDEVGSARDLIPLKVFNILRKMFQYTESATSITNDGRKALTQASLSGHLEVLDLFQLVPISLYFEAVVLLMPCGSVLFA